MYRILKSYYEIKQNNNDDIYNGIAYDNDDSPEIINVYDDRIDAVYDFAELKSTITKNKDACCIEEYVLESCEVDEYGNAIEVFDFDIIEYSA